MHSDPRVIIFTCNWNAHQSLQAAGKEHLHYPPGARPLMVDCLGQVSPSLVFKAFEKGADGVMLVGCSPDECHYEFGSRRAAELYEEIRALADILGFGPERLEFHQIHTGEGRELVAKVRAFVGRLGTAAHEEANGAKDSQQSGVDHQDAVD